MLAAEEKAQVEQKISDFEDQCRRLSQQLSDLHQANLDAAQSHGSKPRVGCIIDPEDRLRGRISGVRSKIGLLQDCLKDDFSQRPDPEGISRLAEVERTLGTLQEEKQRLRTRLDRLYLIQSILRS